MGETWKEYMERLTSTPGYIKIPPVYKESEMAKKPKRPQKPKIKY